MLNLRSGLISITVFSVFLFSARYGYSDAEMVFTKDVDIFKAKPYEVLTYIIYYSNFGDFRATNVIIIDYLPEQTQYLQDSAETNNQLHSGTVAVEYCTNTAPVWQSSNYDNTNGNVSNILMIRWSLNDIVSPGEKGTIEFMVLIK